jgi:hypothetical protein
MFLVPNMDVTRADPAHNGSHLHVAWKRYMYVHVTSHRILNLLQDKKNHPSDSEREVC